MVHSTSPARKILWRLTVIHRSSATVTARHSSAWCLNTCLIMQMQTPRAKSSTLRWNKYWPTQPMRRPSSDKSSCMRHRTTCPLSISDFQRPHLVRGHLSANTQPWGQGGGSIHNLETPTRPVKMRKLVETPQLAKKWERYDGSKSPLLSISLRADN